MSAIHDTNERASQGSADIENLIKHFLLEKVLKKFVYPHPLRFRYNRETLSGVRVENFNLNAYWNSYFWKVEISCWLLRHSRLGSIVPQMKKSSGTWRQVPGTTGTRSRGEIHTKKRRVQCYLFAFASSLLPSLLLPVSFQEKLSFLQEKFAALKSTWDRSFN